MNINHDLLSEELLLLVDEENSQKNAKLFLDVTLRLTEIDGLTEAQKRKRVKENFELFSGSQFAEFNEEDLDAVNEIANSINRVWDDLINNFSNGVADIRDKFYRSLKMDDAYYDVMKEIKSYMDRNDGVIKTLYENVQEIVQKYDDSSLKEGEK